MCELLGVCSPQSTLKDFKLQLRERFVSVIASIPYIFVDLVAGAVMFDPISGFQIPTKIALYNYHDDRLVSLAWTLGDRIHNQSKDPVSGLVLPADVRFHLDVNSTSLSWFNNGRIHNVSRDFTDQVLPAFVEVQQKGSTFAYYQDGIHQRTKYFPFCVYSNCC